MMTENNLDRLGVVGGGAWGTALAAAVARRQTPPLPLWVREADVARTINQRHENQQFLPNIQLPANITATQELTDLDGCDVLLLVVPAQYVRPIMAEIATFTQSAPLLVLCAKGLEQTRLKFMSQVAAEYVSPTRCAVLSGPSFAADVARDLPAAITLACADSARAQIIAQRIANPHLRLYLSDDVLGAEIGGVVKNVLAIACGIVDGRQLGASARAAIITRGFAEMQRLGAAHGAQPETLIGLCGLGDLILTCTSNHSRNFALGQALGQGQNVEDFLGARASVSEGAMSAEAVKQLADQHAIAMPICAAVADIVTGRQSVADAIETLLARPTGYEQAD